MDPESGSPMGSPSGEQGSQRQEGPSALQLVIRALLTRLQGLVELLAPGKKDVGVENRFYYDEVTKQWKLRGGETDQERAEAEAIRFHTSRGMCSASAPATTACDASRGASDNSFAEPPPMGGAVSRSLHGGGGAAMSMASLAHPVYAPQGLGSLDAPPPMAARPTPGPAVPPQAISTPFGAPPALAAQQPISTPFGAPPALAAQQPISTPFGAPPALAAQQPISTPFGAPPSQQPITSPFGAAPPQQPQTSPFGAPPAAAAPLSSPFQGPPQ